jgi:hypothetical protein
MKDGFAHGLVGPNSRVSEIVFRFITEYFEFIPGDNKFKDRSLGKTIARLNALLSLSPNVPIEKRQRFARRAIIGDIKWLSNRYIVHQALIK